MPKQLSLRSLPHNTFPPETLGQPPLSSSSLLGCSGGRYVNHNILPATKGVQIVVEGGKVQGGVPTQDLSGGDDAAQEGRHHGGIHHVLT